MMDASDVTKLYQILGKLETQIGRVIGLEDRLRTVESTLTKIEAQQRPRTPWYSVIAAVVGIITGIATVVTLIVTAANLAAIIGGI